MTSFFLSLSTNFNNVYNSFYSLELLKYLFRCFVANKYKNNFNATVQ